MIRFLAKASNYLRSFALTASLLTMLAGTAGAQVVDTTMWGFSPGDRVLAIAREGNTIYLGGSFLYVGPCTGGGVPVNMGSAVPVSHYPRVIGEVDAVTTDGAGGWYVGGQFSTVGGLPRTNLARILADGSVSDWAPNPDLRVWALALIGQTLYVGGDFNFVGASPRAHLAALNPSSSTPLPWTCDINSRVTALVASGSHLYVGGWFGFVAGQPRSYLAAVDLITGAPTPWQVSLDDRVRSLAIGDTTLYVGGYFTTANAEAHRSLVAVGAMTGAVHSWDPALDRIPASSLDFGPHVNALLVSGQSLFVAGSFSKLGGQDRRGLAQLDLNTAQATAWNPRAIRHTTLGPEFWSLAQSGDTLFVAGAYDTLVDAPGEGGGNTAALSSSTAARFDWDPRTNDFVFTLAPQRGVLYLGGLFTSVGEWVERRGLAAIDATTGKATAWNPQPDDYIKCLTVYGGKVYVGGNFSQVGGQSRNFLAALDPVTGAATAWNPDANAAVWAIAPKGSTVLAGGFFDLIGGRTQRALAAIDTLTGLATSWNPNAVGDVSSLVVSDSAVYVGGDFQNMGGQPRASLAALDPVSGLATPWNPGTDGIVEALATLDGIIYVGGYFHSVGGLARTFLAAVDGSGAAIPWAPNASGPNDDGRVQALATSDSTVYAGGFFSEVSGEPREYFAALDAKTAAVRESYPTVNGPVWALATDNAITYVGGGFGRVGPWPQACFGAINPILVQGPIGEPRLALSQCAPNPVLDGTVIRYSLPINASVSLTAFDLQGRAVAKLLSHTMQTAGQHQVSLSTAGWRSGCYLYRLEAGSHSTTRKMVVVK